MATVPNTSYQATEHAYNAGRSILPVKWTWNLDNSSHAAGEALSAVETITGATRRDGFTSRIVECRLAYSVSSGTPAPKETRLYFMSKTGIPATAPVVSTAQVIVQADAPYILGSFDVATADWLILDKVATITKSLDINCYNEDTTIGTSIYTFALNTTTTWTPPSGSKLEVTLWIELQ